MEGIGSSHLICSIKKSQAHMCYDGSKTIPKIHGPSPSLRFFLLRLAWPGVFLSDGHILALGDGSQSFCQIGVEDIVA